MLKKLIKHEIYATGRILLPLYGITIILSFVNRIMIGINKFNNTPLNIISTITMFFYVFAIIATIITTFILIVFRFYKNLMTDEGYLMFTLPVKPFQLINSKLISAIFWIIISVVVTITSLLILLLNAERVTIIRDIWAYVYKMLKNNFGDNYVYLFLEMILITFISIIQQILLIYVSIAAGHLFSGHKILGSFASYIAINTAAQLVSLLVLLAMASFTGSSFEKLEKLPHAILIIAIVLCSIYSILYYLATNYILSKKLNLE